MCAQLSFAKPIEAYRGRRRGGRWAVLLFLGALVVAGIAVVAFVARSASQVVDSGGSPLLVTIEPGQGTPEIGELLLERGLIVSKSAFSAAVVLEGARSKLQAGTYELSPAMSARAIAELLRDGKTKELQVTVPEGLRLDEEAELLDDKGIVEREDFLRAARESYEFSFLQSKPEGQNLEGFLFPDTYHFAPEVTAREIVNKMLENFENKIAELLPDIETDERALYEILTLASLVEGEVPHQEDRSLVAGVFMNRLDKDIVLQADSTLAYITKEDRIDFTSEDTEIDNPYNTYLYGGLPPGPINSPGLSALQAALHPEETDFMYFVSDPDTGETHFAKTLAEHNENVKKYLND
ncbi:MAG: endolytic transglycosylase MltG [Parcubacteria group bacterium]